MQQKWVIVRCCLKIRLPLLLLQHCYRLPARVPLHWRRMRMVMLLGQVEVVQVDWQMVALMQNDVSYVGYGAQLTDLACC